MKILAVRVGRLGDMVMITPALDAVLAKFPEAELTLLTSPEGRRVLAGFDPRITDVWVHRRKKLFPLLERAALRKRIRAGGFDRIYLFESRASYAAMVRDAAPTVARLPAADATAPAIHFAERCLRMVDPHASPRSVRLPVSDAGRARAAATFAEVGIDESAFAIGFHPSFSERRRLLGGSSVRRNKHWPADKWAELARRLRDRARTRGVSVRIVMELTPEDSALGDEIAAASEGAVTALVPPPDFERYKAALARMNLFVAPDTGPMHLAAAVGTPVVALFSGKDPADCGPYTDPARRAVLRAEDSPGGGELGLIALEPECVATACERFLPDG